jgi:crotonobetainyl-CoA:carnitine CoA-transferase CaiB-like acyl-CoA transferase
VIVENLSPGVMDRWGVSPDAVHAVNPGCVFLSMRGYRDHPSVAGLRAYAPALSSASGMEALVRYPGEPPTGAMTIAFADVMAASQGLLLALAGLRARMVRGHGTAIAMSQFESAIFANGHNIVAAQLGAPPAIEPVTDERLVVGSDRLTRSAWVSPDLFGTVQPRRLPPVTVARLPWRRDGRFAPLGAAGPELGEHTDQILDETGGRGWITA